MHLQGTQFLEACAAADKHALRYVMIQEDTLLESRGRRERGETVHREERGLGFTSSTSGFTVLHLSFPFVSCLSCRSLLRVKRGDVGSTCPHSSGDTREVTTLP